MKILEVKKYLEEGKAVVSASIESPAFQENQTLFFAYPERYYEYLPDTADPFFPALLIPSMLAGEDLEVIPPLSLNLLRNSPTIQEVFTSWFPGEFTCVKVICRDRIVESKDKLKANATFFSLGVDSMYTMLKYHSGNYRSADKQIRHLIYMKGLELPLSVYSKGQGDEVQRSMRSLAMHYDLDLIPGETNIRDVFPLVWENYYSGPGLAATALSLSGGLRNVYIPSSHSYANLAPNPSSPLIDNLWSNQETNIVHDGAEIERARKISDMIAKDQFALNNLRVCVSNNGSDYNCGRCWKCVRTMITLRIIGRLHEATSFPDHLPAKYYRQLRTFVNDSLRFTIENLKLAREYGDKEMERILDREIRIGKLDQFREGKKPVYLASELMYYYLIKAGRKLKLMPW